MQLISDPREFRAACAARRARGLLGFVPTMGALHRGHVELMQHARARCHSVAVSIFVNPTQFGPNEDLARYPRDLAGDTAACERAGVDLLFTPSPEAMYPPSPGEAIRIEPGSVAAGLCGRFRPGHFSGVCTVVAKFWNLTGACYSVFGRKDYQQWKVLQRLARDLLLDVEVVGHATVREADGLALSSRNRYLSELQRESALGIVRGLRQAQRAFEAGERSQRALVELCAREVSRSELQAQYVELVDADELVPFETDTVPERAVLAVAAFAGQTRLIDNCVLGEDTLPEQQSSAEPRSGGGPA